MACDDCSVEVNGERLVLDPSGAAWWPAESTLVFADLHLEKGSAYARGGQLLPPYDTRTTLKHVEAVVARRGPKRVIALGDSFHDGGASERLDERECAALKALCGACQWLWIEGNHDPAPPAWLGGTVASQAAIGGLVFRHRPGAGACRGELAGHLHPAVRIRRRGMSLRRRCFVSNGERLLLPAFGAFTGGLDVSDAVVAALFEGGFAVYALGSERVYAVADQLLRRKKNVEPQPSRIAIRTVETP